METPRRRPTRKLSFGDMFGMRSGDTQAPPTSRPTKYIADEDESHDSRIRKWTPYIVIVLGAVFALDLYFGKNSEISTYNDKSSIEAMVWNGRIEKKYFSGEGKSIHYILEIKDAKEGNKVIDLTEEHSKFWDNVDAFATVSKPANSLKVNVKNYGGGNERNVDLKF
jgi:hypothetical protein